MLRALFALLFLASCGGVSWNTTVANHPRVRSAMVASVVPGETTEKQFTLRWGKPTQKQREGGQTTFIYRNMSNPPGYYAPQFGNSQDYVVVQFQYGLAVGAYSSDTEGCRATFPPRPPGHGFDNPSTVHAVNCGVTYDGSTERRPIADAIHRMTGQDQKKPPRTPASPPQMVPSDEYQGHALK